MAPCSVITMANKAPCMIDGSYPAGIVWSGIQSILVPESRRTVHEGCDATLSAQRQDERGGRDRMVGRHRRDGGADGKVFDDVAVPTVAVLVDLRADDALRTGCLRLRLHPRQSQLARVVDRL